MVGLFNSLVSKNSRASLSLGNFYKYEYLLLRSEERRVPA